MSSTEHFRRFRCAKCGGDAVIATAKHGNSYTCECACGHVYKSTSLAAGASWQRLQAKRNGN
ncbi:hypothetical protein QMM96_22040 [Citrobacter freundii]|uniref:hypothetical protein n=1 Tax=Citrobacter freundii TaxID=546 RepID=UPI002B255E53|nr:hypothetical protein [Citrobacter freundii]MEB2478113.1 hypothetical protein [Citrobacter freundii]